MIKKITLSLLFVFITIGSFSQTIVSTDPENKNVVLEEYTGIHCVWCPEGHAIARAMQNNNPGDVFVINIHEGGFAVPGGNEPDFRTQFGTAIANQAYGGPTGHFYPAGSINRHVFSGSTTAMSRSSWTSRGNIIMDQPSYVNVGVEADIDVQTREITVHVEAYYTGDSPEPTNLLNIALLQNNTLGPQTGGDMGSEYVHMRRLVWLITGQWGVSISPTTAGTFIDETFTYTIPADYNEIPAMIEDMEIVAFLTETQQEIPTGSGCFPTYSNFVYDNDAYLRYFEDIEGQCGFDFSPSVSVQNLGANDLTTLTFEYSVNSGTPQNYVWNGSISPMQYTSIELPAISSYYIESGSNTIEVSISNDENNSNNSIVDTFESATSATNTINMILNTDNAGNQCTWEIINLSGEIVYSGGPYDNNDVILEQFDLPDNCYQFSIYDSAGNGGGSVVLYDSNSVVVYQSPGNYGAVGSSYFETGDFLGVNENELQNVGIYPNPVSSLLNITNAENADIQVYDVLGNLILSRVNISFMEQINVDHLSTGTYFIKIKKGNAIATERFIVSK
jgi:hypothetical protein